MKRATLRLVALAVMALPLSVGRAAVATADGASTTEPDYGAQLTAIAPAVVTLKYLAVYDATFEDATTCRGFVVDPTGLVLVSNENFGEGATKIRDVKVLLGNDPKEWGAVIVARVKTLDLAYVQILDLEGRALTAIDLEKGREPRIGENLFGVTRHGRGFDYAPTLKRLYVTGRIESPSLFWDFTGDFAEAGLPVFDLGGRPAGVIVVQQSAEGSDEDGGTHQDLFLLPLGAVSKSLALARSRVPEIIAKAKEALKESTDAPKEPPTDGAGMADAPRALEPAAPEPAAPGSGK